MSLNAKLTSLADKYRSAFNTGDKFSINDMISGMDGLEAHNYVTGLAQDGNLVSWKDGVGSYSTDSNEKIKNLDICRLIFDIGIEDKHNYSLQVSMKGQGTFQLYV